MTKRYTVTLSLSAPDCVPIRMLQQEVSTRINEICGYWDGPTVGAAPRDEDENGLKLRAGRVSIKPRKD